MINALGCGMRAISKLRTHVILGRGIKTVGHNGRG